MSKSVKIVKVSVPMDISNKLEALSYEIEARKDVISFCINRGMDLNSPTFKEYHDQLTDFTMQYEMMKKEMANEYVYKDYPNAPWRLNFDTCELSIEVEE